MAHYQLKQDDQLLMFWDEYELCREKQLVVTRMPADPQGKKEKIVVVEWPTGLSQLPGNGGVGYQEYLKMKVFNAFLSGEREGVFLKLAGK